MKKRLLSCLAMKDWKFNDRKKKGTSFVCYNVELKASIMDSQTFETFDVSVDEDIKRLGRWRHS